RGALDAAAAGRAVAGPVSLPDRGEAGLMHGWSGPGMLFLRMHDLTGEETWLDATVQALRMDLDQCVRTPSGALQVEQPGVRTLSYLETGSAGILLAATQLLARRHDSEIGQAVPQLIRACAPELVLQANLWNGRAGLLAALALLGPPYRTEAAPLIERHLSRLGWHAVSFRGHIAFPGDQSLRLSMDLATGTAGVLTAVHTARTGGTAPFLPLLPPMAAEDRYVPRDRQ